MRTPRSLVAATMTAALVAGCGSSDDDAGGAWTYTDDRGEEISLEARPERLVVQSTLASALSDYGIDVVATFGPLRTEGGEVDPQVEGLDVDSVEDVSGSSEMGGFAFEKLAETEPDLIVSNMYVPPELWYVPADEEQKAAELAPTLGLDFSESTLPEVLERVEKLAVALGADLDSEQVHDGQLAFDEASDRLRSVAEGLDGQQILFASATDELLYLAGPGAFADVDHYRSLGLPIVQAEASAGSPWEELSWENADKYPADIVVWDSRIPEAQRESAQDQPAFRTLAAAREDAYVDWAAVTPPSPAGYARVMDRLADALEPYAD
ncbi:ABC transporter substrate-binding protein [Aeromicrobium sp. CTD01-1L150]|uniref:ABC transporter substrate-binding protein n=1 Tax=Aeromicrobium sp. CTD01-1L150 TaxID=3341830 RepID=UPI0035C17A33